MPRQPDLDDQLAALGAALIRLEVSQTKTKEELDFIGSDVTRLKRDVAEVQTTIQAFATIGDDLKALRAIKKLILGSGVAIVSAILAFVILVYGLRDRMGVVWDQLIEVKGKQEHTEKGVHTIDVNVRSMSSSLDEWRKAEERRVTESERRLEKLEDKRHP